MFMRNHDIQPNQITYAAMISAYGKAGAIYEAFNLVDELLLSFEPSSMKKKKTKPLKIDIFRNLMCACISQPDYGFRYALMVWQMGLTYGITPDLQMYQLLLKAANDCSLCSPKERIYLEPSSSFEQSPPIKMHQNMNTNLFPVGSEEHSNFKEELDEMKIIEGKWSDCEGNKDFNKINLGKNIPKT
jgi:pentatricopeptide repeat protein